MTVHLSCWRGLACCTLLLVPGSLAAADPKPLQSFGEHTGAVTGVAYTPNGKTVVTCSADKTIRLWDAESGRRNSIIRHTEPLTAVAVSPDGKVLVAADKAGSVLFYDIATGDDLHTLTVPGNEVVWLGFTPDGKTLATIGAQATEAVLWDAVDKSPRLTLKHPTRIHNVAFNYDSRRAVTSGDDGEIRFWQVEDGLRTATARGHDGPVYHAAFAPDGRSVVSTGRDKTIRLWDSQTAKSLEVWDGNADEMRYVVFSGDSKTVMSLSLRDSHVRLWKVDGGKPRGAFPWTRKLATMPAYNSSIAMNPENWRVLVGHNQEAQVWDLWGVLNADN